MPRSVVATSFLRMAALGAVVLTGCIGPDADVGAGELVITEHCIVSGAGALAGGDVLSGDVHDEGGVPVGSWDHAQGADELLGTPTTLVCRINGSRIADVTGSGSWNGAPGYSYTLHVQDRGDPSMPSRVAGTPETRTLVATHTYHPRAWTDGTTTFTDGALVSVPASLPVTQGNAGNEWAQLTFVDHDTGVPTRCSYRGGASRANPVGAADVALGLSYVWQSCETCVAPAPRADGDDHGDDHGDDDGHHGDDHGDHDDDGHHGDDGHGDDDDGHHGDDGHGECHDDDHTAVCVWTTAPSVVVGTTLDVDSVDLHVENGSSRYPSCIRARTTVTLDLEASPFVLALPEPDYYRLLVFDPAGTVVLFTDGDLASGDLTIAQLP